MINKILISTPSYSDILNCVNCKFSKQNTFPLVCVAEDIFTNNMEHLERAILANIPEKVICECKHDFHIKREFGDHLFVEVRQYFISIQYY